MKRSRKIWLASGCLAGIAVILLIYNLLFGKLFPYSPIIIGFDRHELEHAVVYTEQSYRFDNMQDIDPYLEKVEEFHHLKFKHKPRIFLFGSKETYAKRTMTRARFCALYNGDIVVSPWAWKEAEDGIISLEIYLRHELSHSLLHQHSGIIRAMSYPKWLLEGVAVYSSNQMGTTWYPSREETLAHVKKGSFLPPAMFKTSGEDAVKLDVPYRIPFMYSEFACIAAYLADTYGMGPFLEYVTLLIDDRDHDAVFRKVFKVDFEEALSGFRKSAEEAGA